MSLEREEREKEREEMKTLLEAVSILEWGPQNVEEMEKSHSRKRVKQIRAVAFIDSPTRNFSRQKWPNLTGPGRLEGEGSGAKN